MFLRYAVFPQAAELSLTRDTVGERVMELQASLQAELREAANRIDEFMIPKVKSSMISNFVQY